MFTSAWDYLVDPANWQGPTGIGARILQHLWYSLLAVAGAAVIAVPIGLAIGHFRRGEIVVVGAVNALRSLPTLGVLTLLVLLLGLGLVRRSSHWCCSASRPCSRGPTRASRTWIDRWSMRPRRWG